MKNRHTVGGCEQNEPQKGINARKKLACGTAGGIFLETRHGKQITDIIKTLGGRGRTL